MIKLNKKYNEVFKIKQKKLKLSQKSIIIAIISLIIIIALIFVVIPNDKVNNVSSENIENEELQDIVLNEEIIEYADISELEQNVIIEQNVVEKEDKENKKNNTTNNKNNADGPPYYIKINYGAQVVTIYKKDAEGNYTVPVKAMVCSTGEATPISGVYKIQYRWKWLGLQGDVYGQYATQIVGNILFHSVPYLERGNPASLEYWEYDKLGTYASAGCIRLKVSDAIWIFNNCERGTKVEFYSSADPGPLGKPSAQKISNAEGNFKNWDPTDPDSNNPWRNYKPEDKDTNKNEDKNNNVENNNQVSKNEVDDNKTNTQVNETKNNEINKNETNNEIANEINTNTTQTNEINTNKTEDETVNEIVNDKNTNTTKENVEIKDEEGNEEKISTNIII